MPPMLHLLVAASALAPVIAWVQSSGPTAQPPAEPSNGDRVPTSSGHGPVPSRG